MFRQQFILKTSILKHIRSYREHFKSTTSVMTHAACCVLRIPIKTFHVRWILSSSLTRRPVQEHIAGFSPSDSSHTREYITIADNRKSCRRLEGEGGGYCHIWAILVRADEWYGFQAVYSGIGYINQRVWV